MAKRKHPLVPLVCWMGLVILALLLALVNVIGQLPSSEQLNQAHTDGMQLGNEICMDVLSEYSALAGPMPAARRPSATAKKGGLL